VTSRLRARVGLPQRDRSAVRLLFMVTSLILK
jgi:hypothetical protein